MRLFYKDGLINTESGEVLLTDFPLEFHSKIITHSEYWRARFNFNDVPADPKIFPAIIKGLSLKRDRVYTKSLNTPSRSINPIAIKLHLDRVRAANSISSVVGLYPCRHFRNKVREAFLFSPSVHPEVISLCAPLIKDFLISYNLNLEKVFINTNEQSFMLPLINSLDLNLKINKTSRERGSNLDIDPNGDITAIYLNLFSCPVQTIKTAAYLQNKYSLRILNMSIFY